MEAENNQNCLVFIMDEEGTHASGFTAYPKAGWIWLVPTLSINGLIRSKPSVFDEGTARPSSFSFTFPQMYGHALSVHTMP
ncbi:hypothetical protein F2Q69_00022010 [Brassica cretica]|uniref:Uncharacterized protein n=1 Tax=Brassica cretica TaxID=69181 RepID=A0A8S9QCK7_BRACR|nr:hypothetical protein F2Q69_00022010 [Brassica cretica]